MFIIINKVSQKIQIERYIKDKNLTTHIIIKMVKGGKKWKNQI